MRFGWDFLLGLIPGLGDVITIVPAGYLLYEAYRLGARRRTMAKMVLNSALDLTLGAVPVAGDLFDMFFKANIRNVALLRRELQGRPDHPEIGQ